MTAKTMAEVLYHEGAWCGDCEYEGWDACSGCRDTCEGYARALTAAGFGLVADAKAEAWDEGANAAWERSTPEVNGAHYMWRSEGDPVNPYGNQP